MSEIYNDDFREAEDEKQDVIIHLSKDDVLLDKTLSPQETLEVTGVNYGKIEWRSSDESKVIVEDGLITAKANTTEPVIISAQYGDAMAICKVTVVTSPKEIIIMPKEEVVLDFAGEGNKQLTATFIPEDSNVNTEIEWNVEKGTDVIKVSQNGLVELNKEKYSTAEEKIYNVYAKNQQGITGTKEIKVKDSRKYGITIKAKANTYCVTLGNTPIVFEVKAEKNGKVVYDDIVVINMDKAGGYEKTIEEVAENGAVVTIKAIYTGANIITGNESVSLTIENSAVEASFSFDYDGHILIPGYVNL